MPMNLLHFIRSTLDLAEDDLRRGDTDRVQHHLLTIRILLDEKLDGSSAVRSTPRPAGGRPQTEEGRKVEEAVKDMLQSGPKHIQDLLQGLEDRGLTVGQGKAANLIAHLRRMDGVDRQARGVYRLV